MNAIVNMVVGEKQVEFVINGVKHIGIIDDYSEEGRDFLNKGQFLVEDSITNECYLITPNAILN